MRSFCWKRKPMPKSTILTTDLRDDTVRQLSGLLRGLHPLLALLQSVHAANTVATAANTVATVENSTTSAAGSGGGGLFGAPPGGFCRSLGVPPLWFYISPLFF